MAQVTRHTFIAGTTAGIAAAGLAGSAAVLAQDSTPELTVGSTNYTEQFIIAEMMALLLEDAGYPITVEHNIGGTLVIHEARNAGDIREEGMSRDEVVEAVCDVVRQGYQEEFNTVWLDPNGVGADVPGARERGCRCDFGVLDRRPHHLAGLRAAGRRQGLLPALLRVAGGPGRGAGGWRRRRRWRTS